MTFYGEILKIVESQMVSKSIICCQDKAYVSYWSFCERDDLELKISKKFVFNKIAIVIVCRTHYVWQKMNRMQKRLKHTVIFQTITSIEINDL